MARPKPNIVMQVVDAKTYQAEQVLDAEKIYAVFHKDRPINIRTLNTLVNYPGPKYKKCSFTSAGSALALARRLNKVFKCEDFVVRELIAGPIYEPE